MKRLGSSHSLGALMTICPPTDEHSPRNKHVYGREFQSMLEGYDEEGYVEESGHHHSEKKRRLSVDQVKSLEKNFEVENKLEPERKVKLAQELGLQPRQVAVWFQNRRARWKTKQLEKDYGVVKANYDSLKLNFDNLQRDNQSLHKEVNELKSRLQEENSESDVSVKEEMMTLHDNSTPPSETGIPGSDSKDLNCEVGGGGSLFPIDFKDGSSDSDSSAILNEDNSNNNTSSPNVGNSSSGVLQGYNFLMSSDQSSMPSSTSCFQFQKQYQTQYVRMEEHNFFSGDDEACNFFSDEQPPTLQQWYSSHEWN